MKITPLVSVAVITYNHEEYIERALESVCNQKTDFNYEIIIGDDSSTDRTSEICKEFADKFPEKIHHIRHEKNKGFINNLLYVISECNGEYIALLEADDYWLTDQKLYKQIKIFKENPDVGLCYTNSAVDDLKVPEKTKYFDRKHDEVQLLADCLPNMVAPTSSYLFRKEYFNPPRWFNKVAAYEYYLLFIVAEHGSVYYLNECTSCRTQHYKGLSTTVIKKRELLMSKIIFMQNLLNGFSEVNRRKYQNTVLKTQIHAAYHLLLNIDRESGKKCLRHIYIFKARLEKDFFRIWKSYIKYVVRSWTGF